MRGSWVGIGLILVVLAIFITIFTLGLGIICTGPMFLIGIILFIIGLILPENEPIIIKQEQKPGGRFCPDCGRAIPFDANICPYCGKKF